MRLRTGIGEIEARKAGDKTSHEEQRLPGPPRSAICSSNKAPVHVAPARAKAATGLFYTGSRD